MKTVPHFLRSHSRRCLTYKDVDTQLAAARAIGNFALDSYGRNKVAAALPLSAFFLYRPAAALSMGLGCEHTRLTASHL